MTLIGTYFLRGSVLDIDVSPCSFTFWDQLEEFAADTDDGHSRLLFYLYSCAWVHEVVSAFQFLTHGGWGRKPTQLTRSLEF